MVVRTGTVRIVLEESEWVIHTGNVLVLPAETRFRAIPVPRAVLTSIFINQEYALDHIYWQYREHLNGRAEARMFSERFYSEVRRIVPLWQHFKYLTPLLETMISLSEEHDFSTHSNQLQSHWFAIAHTLTLSNADLQSIPFLKLRKALRAVRPEPIRTEVLLVDSLLREHPQRNWTLTELAARVHLSAGHLSSLCSRVWGYPPRTRLQLIRVDLLAKLLCEARIPIKQCIYQVGWRNHSHAAGVFRALTGLSPVEYRAQCGCYNSEILEHEIKGSGHEIKHASD